MKFYLSLLLMLSVAACGHDDDSERVSFSELSELQTITVSMEKKPAYHSWDGVVEAVQQATLTAQTSGQIDAVLVDVNHVVNRSQTLVTLAGVEQHAGLVAARSQLHAAEAALAEAVQTHARYELLVGKGYVSKNQMDQAIAARNAAEANRSAARAQVSQARRQNDYTTIKAPFSGVISQRLVEPGESVSAGRPVLLLYAPDQMRVEVSVPQSIAQVLRQQKKPQAKVRTDAGQLLPLSGVVVYPSADPLNHSVLVRLNLEPNQSLPPPGTTVNVQFDVSGVGSASVGEQGWITIPKQSVQRRGEVVGVYVLSEDGTRIQLRQLRLGSVQGDRIEVLSGLTEGDVIALDSLQALKARVAQRQSTGHAQEK